MLRLRVDILDIDGIVHSWPFDKEMRSYFNRTCKLLSTYYSFVFIIIRQFDLVCKVQRNRYGNFINCELNDFGSYITSIVS
jgi:hypothetical protein